MTIPTKLRRGDGIRIISPSLSLGIISEDVQRIATERLSSLGYEISFGKHASSMDSDSSSPIKERLEDLHDAFRDPSIKLILSSIGGFNSNQLLPYIDYDLIRSNPKILCGYSDITGLANALFAKTDLVTYSGPHFSTFGQQHDFDFTLSHFTKCLVEENPYAIEPADRWSNDKWYIDQEKREFVQNDGYWVINEGQMQGSIIGGNLSTLNLLQGTRYMPPLEGSILFIEDDNDVDYAIFERDLVSLTQLPDFCGVKGMVIGRFERESAISREDLERLCRGKQELVNIPIVANADFGHTDPKITFPIGGTAEIVVEGGKTFLQIIAH